MRQSMKAISGGAVEDQTLVGIHSSWFDLEFILPVDQDRGAGSRTDHAGCFPRAVRTLVQRHHYFDSTRAIAAHLQRMDCRFSSLASATLPFHSF